MINRYIICKHLSWITDLVGNIQTFISRFCMAVLTLSLVCRQLNYRVGQKTDCC